MQTLSTLTRGLLLHSSGLAIVAKAGDYLIDAARRRAEFEEHARQHGVRYYDHYGPVPDYVWGDHKHAEKKE